MSRRLSFELDFRLGLLTMTGSIVAQPQQQIVYTLIFIHQLGSHYNYKMYLTN